jgi:hypothetical protein
MECALPNGSTCTGNPQCATGVCADGVCCSPGNFLEECGGDCPQRCEVLDECNVNADCASGLCVLRGMNKECVLPNGSACTSDPQCRTGSCADKVCCTPGNITEECGGDCPQRCNVLDQCSVDADCASGLCVLRGMNKECVLPNGNACTGNPQCATGVCADDVCCSPGNFLEECGGDCPQRCEVLDECNVNADCASGLCVSRGMEKECVLPNGNACTSDPQCRTGFCIADTCCSPSDLTAECGGDCSTRCANGERCNVGEDCATRFCQGGDCGFAPVEAGPSGGCADGVDNDGDGRRDCVDLDCLDACRAPAPALAPVGLLLAVFAVSAVAASRFLRGRRAG